MKLIEFLHIGRLKLQNCSATPFLDTEILVGFVLGLSRTELILKNNLELNAEQEKNILEFIERRAKNEPMAYLTNKKEFYGLEFYVDENVLIPRPETEVLVEAVVELVESLKFKVKSVTQSLSKSVPFEILRQAQDDNLKIIDVGTGSACIPIALAQKLKNVDFVAIDISEKALEVARKNVVRFGLEKRIEVVFGDLLEVQSSKFKVQSEKKNSVIQSLSKSVPLGILRQAQDDTFNNNIIITANLPYVENGAELSSEVKDYEPHLALFAGADGLDLYRRLLVQIAEIKPRAVFLEIDPRQVANLREISTKILPEYEIEIVKDLSGKDRVFVLNLLN